MLKNAIDNDSNVSDTLTSTVSVLVGCWH